MSQHTSYPLNKQHVQICQRPIEDNHINKQTKNSTSPNGPIPVKPLQLLACVLHILSHLHSHVKNGTVPTGADDLIVHAPLTPLALRPQPRELDLQLRHLRQGLVEQLREPRAAVHAHRAVALLRPGERLLAAQTRRRPSWQTS